MKQNKWIGNASSPCCEVERPSHSKKMLKFGLTLQLHPPRVKVERQLALENHMADSQNSQKSLPHLPKKPAITSPKRSKSIPLLFETSIPPSV